MLSRQPKVPRKCREKPLYGHVHAPKQGPRAHKQESRSAFATAGISLSRFQIVNIFYHAKIAYPQFPMRKRHSAQHGLAHLGQITSAPVNRQHRQQSACRRRPESAHPCRRKASHILLKGRCDNADAGRVPKLPARKSTTPVKTTASTPAE